MPVPVPVDSGASDDEVEEPEEVAVGAAEVSVAPDLAAD